MQHEIPSAPAPAEPAHSVEQHLRVSVGAYDAAIRVFIPYYDEMLGTAVELLAALAPPAPRVLDLGGGTGALSQAVLRGLPQAQVERLDVDPQMLAQARIRLAPEGGRVRFREASFGGTLPRCDAVVASLALHHVHDLAEKTGLYAEIQRCLEPGGVFLNLDATVSGDAKLAALTFERWAAAMEHGVTSEQARRHFADWAREDRYFSLRDELTALAGAGFAHPECFWRRGPVAIYGGVRSETPPPASESAGPGRGGAHASGGED